MNNNHKVLTNRSKIQALEALNLILASINSYMPFDTSKTYTPQEREPYDAMCDRFIRAVEICLKFFRSYELLVEGTNSETIRDLLNKMEKFEFIRKEIVAMLGGLLRRGEEEGEVRKDIDSVVVGKIMQGVVTHLANPQFLVSVGLSMEEFVGTWKKIYMNGFLLSGEQD